MYFKLRKDADNWFKGLEKDLKVKWNAYYFCSMTGIASLSHPEAPESETTDLVDYFPQPFSTRSRLIVASLLFAELKRLEIDYSSKVAVDETIKELVDPFSPSRLLSDPGVSCMNRYAFGGFDILQDNFTDRPRSIDTFIRKYGQLINKLFSENY